MQKTKIFINVAELKEVAKLVSASNFDVVGSPTECAKMMLDTAMGYLNHADTHTVETCGFVIKFWNDAPDEDILFVSFSYSPVGKYDYQYYDGEKFYLSKEEFLDGLDMD